MRSDVLKISHKAYVDIYDSHFLRKRNNSLSDWVWKTAAKTFKEVFKRRQVSKTEKEINGNSFLRKL